MDEVTSQLSENLKLIRKEHNYSLDDLAEKTGVSKSMLRQIEMGESSPSISTVWKIANGLKTSFTSLLARPQDSVSIVGFLDKEPLVEKGSAYRLYPLFPYDSARKFEVYYIEMDQGALLESEGHAGAVEEFVFVLSGAMTIAANKATHEIGRNQAIRFNASSDHRYANAGNEQARAIMIIYYGSKS
jgi:XRE family transcriptional regulator, regulator of sulfur utilization